MELIIATEIVEALRYNLRMFGVKIEGQAEFYCDNNSVVTNYSVPESVLNKRHNTICYHRVRESQAARTLKLGWIPGGYNIADLLTKTTMKRNMRHGMVKLIFYNKLLVIREKEKI